MSTNDEWSDDRELAAWDRVEAGRYSPVPGHLGLVINDRVELTGSHPHAGKTGTVDGFELLRGLRVERPRVRLDSGGGCFVTGIDEFRVLR